MVLKSIGVMSAAKISGVMYAIIGLIGGLMIALVFSFLPMAAPDEANMPGWLGPMFGMGSLIIMPIVYGIMGFIIGAISAVIYNVLAGMIGGLVLNLEPTTRA